jgi:SAM-dependent methyltransferase
MGNLRKALYKSYHPLQRAITPGLRNSQFAYKEKLITCLTPRTRWLDLGCGHQLLPDWMPNWQIDQAAIVKRCQMVVGIDGDFPSLVKHQAIRNRVRGNIELLPFRNETFDLVTANVVVEHVEDPAALLTEIHRILLPGGVFLFHTPNFYGYASLVATLMPRPLRLKTVELLQGRKEEDVFPTHYRCNTSAAVRSLAETSGFAVSELAMVESSAQTVMLGPLVLLELLLIAALRLDSLRNFRTNIIAVLQKPKA